MGQRSELRPVRISRQAKLLLATLVAIKILIAVGGVFFARHGQLSRRDYEHNYHHHRLIDRYANPANINFVELWVTSDAQWYLAIAEDGYPTREQLNNRGQSRGPKLIANTDTRLKYAFFPLWPITIRAAQSVIRDWNAAAYFAANLISVAALMLLYRLLAQKMSQQAAIWSVVLLATWPFAMFLHVPFTESLFLFLSVLTFHACAKRRWWLAAIWVGLGLVTRPNGLALAIVPPLALAVDLCRDRAQPWRRVGSLLFGAMLAAIPLGLFLWHNAVRTGDAFYFSRVIEWWGYNGGGHLQNLYKNTYGKLLEFPTLPGHGFHRSKIDFLVLVLAGLLLALGVRRLSPTEWAYSAAIIVIPLLTKNDLMSFSRYALMAWPLVTVPVGLIRPALRSWTFAVMAVVFFALQLWCVHEFVNWHWVA
ncbi:Mannosyltransferase (PIG-V) [Phycisphaerae bacterium RAS2]|nr:Mannosyltransferase (PIG-V) [Phycisphaerae bacterium RAS2]